MKHSPGRREFVKAGIGAAITVGSPWPLVVCPAPAQEPHSDIHARVAAIRGDNLGSMTRDAIDALGGIRKIVNPGETVFIKPDFCHDPLGKG